MEEIGMNGWRTGLAGVVGALLAVGVANAPQIAARAAPDSPSKVGLAAPGTYVLDFVSTAADGVDMNDAGDVVGTSYPDPGCGSALVARRPSGPPQRPRACHARSAAGTGRLDSSRPGSLLSRRPSPDCDHGRRDVRHPDRGVDRLAEPAARLIGRPAKLGTP